MRLDRVPCATAGPHCPCILFLLLKAGLGSRAFPPAPHSLHAVSLVGISPLVGWLRACVCEDCYGEVVWVAGIAVPLLWFPQAGAWELIRSMVSTCLQPQPPGRCLWAPRRWHGRLSSAPFAVCVSWPGLGGTLSSGEVRYVGGLGGGAMVGSGCLAPVTSPLSCPASSGLHSEAGRPCVRGVPRERQQPPLRGGRVWDPLRAPERLLPAACAGLLMQQGPRVPGTAWPHTVAGVPLEKSLRGPARTNLFSSVTSSPCCASGMEAGHPCLTRSLPHRKLGTCVWATRHCGAVWLVLGVLGAGHSVYWAHAACSPLCPLARI